MLMRAVADGFLLRSTSMGAPGIEEVRWLRPVRPGDRLDLRWTVLETKASRSRPEMGLVRFRFELLRGDEAVLSQTNWIMFGRRDAPPPPEPRRRDGNGGSPPVAEAPAPAAVPRTSRRARFFDDLVVGRTRDFGTHLFTADAIVGFASEFDPQPFHVDPEAARRSHFGGLCASGWHTAAVWMKLMIEDRTQGGRTGARRRRAPGGARPLPRFSRPEMVEARLRGRHDHVTARR